MPDDGRIRITSDDLAGSAMDARVDQMRAAQQAPLVQVAGPAPVAAAQTNPFNTPLILNTIVGLIGGVLGFLISEAFQALTESDALVRTAAGDGFLAALARLLPDSPGGVTTLWSLLFGLGLVTAFVSSEGIQARAFRKVLSAASIGLPVVLVLGAIGGFIAQVLIYSPWFENVVEDCATRGYYEGWTEIQFFSCLESGLVIPRSIGFAVMGGVVGAGLGASSRSGRRALNGLIGGLLGGFVGGFTFNFMPGSGFLSRFIALALTGVATGLAIGFVENIRKEFWLEILSGGMAGKQFILYHDQTLIGSSPECGVTLIKDPAILGRHLWIRRQGTGAVAVAEPGATVLIDGSPTAQAALRDGTTIQIGGTLLRIGDRKSASPAPLGLAASRHF